MLGYKNNLQNKLNDVTDLMIAGFIGLNVLCAVFCRTCSLRVPVIDGTDERQNQGDFKRCSIPHVNAC